MNKPLLLFVGPSGSGKTTVAEYLESAMGYKSVQSYTTRSPRYENETGHIFVSNDEFDKLQDLVAYTEYNGNKYCATSEQVDEADIYVIDVPGVEVFLKKYKNTKRPIYIMYFDVDIHIRIDRMINRHDHDTAIVSRIYKDTEYNWITKLSKIVNKHKGATNAENVYFYIIRAEKDLMSVVDDVLWYIH